MFLSDFFLLRVKGQDHRLARSQGQATAGLRAPFYLHDDLNELELCHQLPPTLCIMTIESALHPPHLFLSPLGDALHPVSA